MKLMLQHRIVALAMMAAGWILALSPTASANDFHTENYTRHSQLQGSFSTDGLPSTLPGGTYVGGISALRVRGNGNYFAVGSGISRQIAKDAGSSGLAPKAKIMTVHAEKADDACAYEHGVCVIRP